MSFDLGIVDVLAFSSALRAEVCLTFASMLTTLMLLTSFLRGCAGCGGRFVKRRRNLSIFAPSKARAAPSAKFSCTSPDRSCKRAAFSGQVGSRSEFLCCCHVCTSLVSCWPEARQRQTQGQRRLWLFGGPKALSNPRDRGSRGQTQSHLDRRKRSKQ